MLFNCCFSLLFCVLRMSSATPPDSAPRVTMSDGRTMPAIALGTFLGHDSEGVKLKPTGSEVENAVKWAIDAGYRHIDTAYIYMVEDQVGRAIASKIADGTVKREDLFVTSKLWNDQHAKERVVPALRATLSRLGLGYLDLFLIHWPFAIAKNGTFEDIDYMETWEGMQEAKRLNLTRSIGLSNFNVSQIERVLTSPQKPAVLQVEINLNLQQPALLEFARAHNITVMGYTPFGSLFGERRVSATPAPPPRLDDPQLTAIAAKYNKTVPQLVLRYLVELGVVPLPKSVTKKRIEDNIQIFDFKLSPDEFALMKSFDKNYRTITIDLYKSSPYYPFGELQA